MKFFLSLSLLMFVSSVYSQVDSLQIQLKQYKALRDSNLINDQDYHMLKQAAIDKKSGFVPTRKLYSEADLKRKYQGEFAAGGVFVGIGAAIITGGVVYVNRAQINYNYKSSLTYEKFRTRNLAAFCAMGSISAVAGIGLLISGGIHKEIYTAKYKFTAGYLDSGNIGLQIVLR